ncbi:MAG TPA: glutamate--tRNA ligase [bacterium]|nr:glutamate--tRNA ligase [bacterium]
MSKVRCRFAPSPTGHLHIGGARTALFNWLFARHEGGEFLLRIEDTDVERSRDEYTQAILAGLKWLGIDWDGEPVFQSRRLELYRREATRLMDEGKAYYCSCLPAELDAMRERALKEGRKPKYDGRCRARVEHPADRPRVVRFKNEQEGETAVDDLIQGRVVFQNEELDDLVLIRGDGTPTYNFAAVIDDHDLGMTHIIRGGDHLNNTPRQIQLYEALGYALPRFAHHPLILGQDKSKLSKRHGATSLISYRDLGYLPEAVMNFLVRIGWSHGDQEVFTKDEMVKLFTIEDVGKAPGVWDADKLLWFNGHYIRQRPVAELGELALPFFKEKGYAVSLDDRFLRIIELHQPRVTTLMELPEKTAYIFDDKIEFEEKAHKKFLKPENAPVLSKVMDRLDALAAFEEKALEQAFTGLAEEMGVKLGKVAQPVRVAVTGRAESPGLFELLPLLGKPKTLERIRRAIEECNLQ